MYQFHLSIGDWSGDGHGRSEDFTVASNAPVETVREAHYKIPEVTEVDIESICSEYGEDEIDAETVQVLKDMGFQFENQFPGMGGRHCQCARDGPTVDFSFAEGRSIIETGNKR